MGRVYRVFDHVAQHECALKRMKLGAESDGFAVQAFEREYSVLVSLNHPLIIRAYDFGVDSEGRYYTMALLNGGDMRRLAPLTCDLACSYLRDIATALSLLHARRLIHRDLSPDNVHATPEGRCMLLDFGALATFGPASGIAGTPPLMAPEVLLGGALDQRVDLFALGALAYWMLTCCHAYPARDISELQEHWRNAPAPPSQLWPDIPDELDQLVLGLLHLDPASRPSSAAEVIARLTAIGGLPAEDPYETRLLAQSFLKNPPFTGRAPELERLTDRLAAALEGRGSVARVVSLPGLGRTRLLEELGVSAQLAGALTLRANARTQVNTYGAARALTLQLIDRLPDIRGLLDNRALSALAALGSDIGERLATLPAASTPQAHGTAVAEETGPEETSARVSAPERITRTPGLPLTGTVTAEAVFASVSHAKPIVVSVDDIDDADDASLGFLAGLAKLAPTHRLLLVFTERVVATPRATPGLVSLRQSAESIELRPFSSTTMLELVRSLFCEAPSLERFSEWLQSHSAGTPLHALELCRRLTTEEVIRYAAGVWTLPLELPDGLFPEGLSDTLRANFALLSEAARDLVEALALTRSQPTTELCRALLPVASELELREILDELVRHDVLTPEPHGYQLSSGAIRDAVLSQMDSDRRERHHSRIGEVLAGRANDLVARLAAGWHLIEGGAELRGAELIASVTWDGTTLRTLAANLHKIGAPLEGAFLALSRHRRSAYFKVPLLSALAQAGYYEDRTWANRYGDQALDLLDELSGLALARDLRRYCGGWIALVVAISLAYLRFLLAPRAERPYSFDKLLVHLFGTATALVGGAALSLDGERAARVAAVLEPFSALPERLTPRGVYDFCAAMCLVCTDNPADTFQRLDRVVRSLEDPRYYPTLPADGRRLLGAGAHFARAILGMLHARGGSALESARVLDETGFVLYAMIASEIRFLYYTTRGEIAAAAPHREQVEMHAARIGSLWQVETWEATVLCLVYSVLLSDAVHSTRTMHRLVEVSRRVRSMRVYRAMDEYALALIHKNPRDTLRVAAEYEALPPRSFLGWSTTLALVARGLNQLGEHERAQALCQRVHARAMDGDRDYCALFIVTELELALAEADLGQIEAARSRLRGELARLEGCDHPLVLGLLYDTAARVAWRAGDAEDFEACLASVERWFRPTGMPALIAKCEQLQQLRDQPRSKRSPPKTCTIGAVVADDFSARDTINIKRQPT